jgi:hypothetical protein
MTQENVAKCFMAGGIMLIVSSFISLVSMVDSYDTYVENHSQVMAAFNG